MTLACQFAPEAVRRLRLSRPKDLRAAAAVQMRHEDQFRPPSLSGPLSEVCAFRSIVITGCGGS
jgi:hypothetical protein